MKIKIKIFTLSLGILALSAAQAFAASWGALSNKGLAIYEIGSTTKGQIRLVCDPDAVWADDTSPDSPQFYLIVTMNNRPLLNETASFKTDQGYSGKLKIEAGEALGSMNKPEWNKFITALSDANQLTINAGSKQFSLDISKKINLRCKMRG